MRSENRKSSQVALGGISVGLCIFLMFLTGMVPFSEYALPALAGLVLIAMAAENGVKSAVVAYAAVSLLGILVVPSKEAACFFLFFFGYYPIAKFSLDGIRPKPLGYLLKLLIFNLSIVAAGWVTINLFGLSELLDEFGSFGKYSVLALLGLGNVFFVFYDYMVTTLIDLYFHWFRVKFLRKK